MADNFGEWKGYKAPQEGSRLPDPVTSNISVNEPVPDRYQTNPYPNAGQKPTYPTAPSQDQSRANYANSAPSDSQSVPTNVNREAQPTSRASSDGSAVAGKRPSIAWPVALVIAVALLSCAIVCTSISCSSTVNGALGSMGFGTQEQVEDSTPKIGVISIASSIAYDGTECSPTGLTKLLDKAESDDSIKGVILWVNSGGGTATAGEEMAAAVKQFEKPIVVVSGATNASAAYEISSQADQIFVGKTTAIGSIGVVLQVTDLSGLYDKLGIKIDNITSTDSKDATFGNRPLTEEEREWYQDMVNQISDDFIKTVAEGRDMTIDEVKELANGLTYTGTDAVENGLADSIGYLDDAIAYISEVAGYSSPLKARVLYLSSSKSISDLISILGENSIDYGSHSRGSQSTYSEAFELD